MNLFSYIQKLQILLINYINISLDQLSEKIHIQKENRQKVISQDDSFFRIISSVMLGSALPFVFRMTLPTI